MELLPIKTKRIEPRGDLVEIIREGMKELGMRNPAFAKATAGREELDIFVISSKAAATAEGRIVDLSSITPSGEANILAEQCGRSPAFCEAVLGETKMRNGTVRGTCPGAIITELKPWSADPSDGFSTRSSTASAVSSLAPHFAKPACRTGRATRGKRREQGTIITANAGLDESNTKQGTAVGWPEDPVESARALRKALNAPIIITDSCVRPRRWGVTAFALAVAGIDPLRDEAGREDLFGRKLQITKEAIADQLATAANMLMGNADQSIPAVIIRDHGLTLSDFEGWVPGIDPEEDLFKGIM